MIPRKSSQERQEGETRQQITTWHASQSCSVTIVYEACTKNVDKNSSAGYWQEQSILTEMTGTVSETNRELKSLTKMDKGIPLQYFRFGRKN